MHKGPLDKGYDPSGLPRRQRVAGMAVQTLVAMKRLYSDNDRVAFDRLIPRFDKAYAILQDDGPAEFGPMLRARMFPRWCHE